MKILIINSGPKPLPAVAGGGVETLIQFLIAGIGDKYDLTVVSVFSEKAEQESKKYPNVKFEYLNINGIKYKLQLIIYYLFNHFVGRDIGNAFCNLLKHKIDVGKYDVVISENGVRLGKSLRKLCKGKLILHLHNDWLNVYTKNASIYKNSYDEIWAISGFLKKRVDAIKGKTITRVLYNGVDTTLFCQSQKLVRHEIRNRYGISDSDIVIANCCRIVEEKGVLQTIKVFKKVQKQYDKNNLKLLIIGDVSNETSYIEKVKAISNEDVIFTGYVPHNELPCIMGCSDIGIASTIHLNSKYGKMGYEGVIECFNLTVIEFLSLGIPVIATNSGGMPEILANDFSDNIIDAQEAKFEDGLLDALLNLLESNEVRKMESKCLQTASIFSKDKYISQFNNYVMNL